MTYRQILQEMLPKRLFMELNVYERYPGMLDEYRSEPRTRNILNHALFWRRGALDPVWSDWSRSFMYDPILMMPSFKNVVKPVLPPMMRELPEGYVYLGEGKSIDFHLKENMMPAFDGMVRRGNDPWEREKGLLGAEELRYYACPITEWTEELQKRFLKDPLTSALPLEYIL